MSMFNIFILQVKETYGTFGTYGTYGTLKPSSQQQNGIIFSQPFLN